MTKQYKSEALAAAHEAALGLAEAGLMSKQTMRAFDEMCLTPVEEMAPEDIRALRLRENASQAVFARLSQRDDRAGEPVGARREASAGSIAEAADAGGEERPGRRGVMPRIFTPWAATAERTNRAQNLSHDGSADEPRPCGEVKRARDSRLHPRREPSRTRKGELCGKVPK